MNVNRRMNTLFHLLQRVAESDADLLIEGESDIPYHLLVAALVGYGARPGKPIVAAPCGGSQWDAEKALFGCAAGLTDLHPHLGAFEAARGGTVHLVEIGDLSLGAQRTLLRALTTRQIRRIGESRPRRVDARVIATSRQSLAQRAMRGQFSDELYRRLSELRVQLPSLHQGAAPALDLAGSVRPVAVEVEPISAVPSTPRTHGALSSSVPSSRRGGSGRESQRGFRADSASRGW
jgi:DNA-binding NtrC family response regulator